MSQTPPPADRSADRAEPAELAASAESAEFAALAEPAPASGADELLTVGHPDVAHAAGVLADAAGRALEDQAERLESAHAALQSALSDADAERGAP